MPHNFSGIIKSVPSRINEMGKIDSCRLLNLSDILKDNDRYPMLARISSRIAFCWAICDIDMVIFEEFYHFHFLKYARRLHQLNIPYIITPRCSLTYLAQHNHAWLKKSIANFIFFKRFARNASAIQFLTEGEKLQSGTKWNKHSFVVPNGIQLPESYKSSFNKEQIKAIYVGRLDAYQKGLDLLFLSLAKLQNELRLRNFILTLYGSKENDYKTLYRQTDEYGISDFVFYSGEITGDAKERAFLDSDLFILTSRFEGHSMALLEALSYGLPVAVTPGTNMTKEVLDFNAGWTSESNDSNGITQMLLKVLSESGSLPIRGHNARKLAIQYNWGEVAERFHNELVKIVSGEEPYDK